MLATVRAAPPPTIHALSRPPTHVQPKVKPPPPPKKLKNPLQVLEIIAKILGYNDKATNARCARVCRMWMEMSLNNLWSELEGVKDLLSILVPLKKSKIGDYWVNPLISFTKLLCLIQWCIDHGKGCPQRISPCYSPIPFLCLSSQEAYDSSYQ